MKLTTAQREALLKLVAYQNQAGREIVFTLKPIENRDEVDRVVRPWGQSGETVTAIPEEFVVLWVEVGLIVMHRRGVGSQGGGGALTFILRQEALDYAS